MFIIQHAHSPKLHETIAKLKTKTNLNSPVITVNYGPLKLCVYSFRNTITEFADLFCVFIPVSPQSPFIFVNFPTWNLQEELFLINLKMFKNKTWRFFQTADCLIQFTYQPLQSALFKAGHHWEQHLVSISKRGLLPSTGMNKLIYFCFLHDVAKIQTTKLSILLRLSFHDVLGQLKNNFHTNFGFKRLLGFEHA